MSVAWSHDGSRVLCGHVLDFQCLEQSLWTATHTRGGSSHDAVSKMLSMRKSIQRKKIKSVQCVSLTTRGRHWPTSIVWTLAPQQYRNELKYTRFSLNTDASWVRTTPDFRLDESITSDNEKTAAVLLSHHPVLDSLTWCLASIDRSPPAESWVAPSFMAL